MSLGSITNISKVDDLVHRLFPRIREVIEEGERKIKNADASVANLQDAVSGLFLARTIIKMIDQPESPILLMLVSVDGRIKYVTKNWEYYLGYRQEDLIGRLFLSYVKRDDLVYTKEVWGKMKKDNKHSFNFKNCYKKKDGGFSCLSWYGTVDSQTGVVLGMAVPKDFPSGIEKLTR